MSSSLNDLATVHDQGLISIEWNGTRNERWGTLSMLFVEVISIDVWRNVFPAFFTPLKEEEINKLHRKVVEFKKEWRRKTEW
jgi:hypothetical protein